MKYLIIALFYFNLFAQSCPVQDYEITTQKFKLENQLEIFKQGQTLPCEIKCQRNNSCLHTCIQKNANKKFTSFLKENFSSQFLNCPEIKKIVANF